MDGLLVVDKPAGPTSHDVVARMRRALGERRIGHTGTLDPAATGVLCLVLGRATRLAQFLSSSDKTYDAVVRFGFATDTGDAQGRAIERAVDRPIRVPAPADVESALAAFRGTYLQQPPAFSAKKIGGRRSHDLARARARVSSAAATRDRQNRPAPPAPPAHPAPPAPPALPALPAPPALFTLPAAVPVTVHELDLVAVEMDTVTLRLRCSAGFYVRTLAHDLGERLGTGAHLASLRRTRSGDFSVEQATPLEALEQDPERAKAAVVAMADTLPGLPAFVLTPDGVRRAMNGCQLGPTDSATGASPADLPNGLVRLLDSRGDLVGVGAPGAAPGLLHPSVVLM